MSREPRFRDTGKSSFFGDFVYKRIIPQDHFLVALNNLFDWDGLSNDLLKAYRGAGTWGRPPYNPVQMFKMLFISYLYGVSERSVEELVNFHLVVKWFIGLAVDEPAPDHSSLTVFKDRYLKPGQEEHLIACFKEIIQESVAQGVELGDLQILDSVHTQADVNAEKEERRQEAGKPPRDPDAAVVNKGRREVVEPDGTRTEKEIRYKGYKTHVSVNAKTGVVTSLKVTPGNEADNKQFPDLHAQDQALGLPIRAYGGDRAYDDTDIYERLRVRGQEIAIHLRSFRTNKKDKNKGRWLRLESSPQYQRDKAQRFRVEQPFGPAKQKHGFERCRYLGLIRCSIQSLFTFLVSNCKRLVKLLTGLTFRPQAKGRGAEKLKPVYDTLPWL